MLYKPAQDVPGCYGATGEYDLTDIFFAHV